MIEPRDLVHYAGGLVFPRYGVLTRRTLPAEDQPETFTRPTPESYIDRDGSAQTAAIDTLPVDWLDLDGDGVLETPVAMFHVNANCVVPYAVQPIERTGYVRLIHPAIPVATGVVFQVGNASDTLERFTLRWGGSVYELLFDNGVTAASAAAPANDVPATGDEIELYWAQGADGAVMLGQAVNGGVLRRSGPTASIGLPVAWGARTRYISNRGDGSASGPLELIADKEVAGLQSFADMRAIG